MNIAAENIAGNIWKLYCIKGLRWFMLVAPIFVLFFQENGLSMAEIMVLQSVFSLGTVIFEIPSGYFADVISRKVSIIIGCILGTVGFAIYSLTSGFLAFLVAESVLGIGSSFISGTDTALLYDSLLALGEKDTYRGIEGRRFAIGNISEGIASVLGGVLALISLRTTFYVETAIMFLAVPIACSLAEPVRQKFESKKGALSGMWEIVCYAMHGSSELKWILLYSSVVTASTLNIVWFFQPYMKFIAFPIVFFGVVWAVFKVAIGFFALKGDWFERVVGRRAAYISILFASVLGYVLMGMFSHMWVIVSILLIAFVRGVGEPIFQNAINEAVSSDRRATVQSLKNFLSRLVFSILGPFIGWLHDVYSLQSALLYAGALFICCGLISFPFWLRDSKKAI